MKTPVSVRPSGAGWRGLDGAENGAAGDWRGRRAEGQAGSLIRMWGSSHPLLLPSLLCPTPPGPGGIFNTRGPQQGGPMSQREAGVAGGSRERGGEGTASRQGQQV